MCVEWVRGVMGSGALWWVKVWEVGEKALTTSRMRWLQLCSRQPGRKELARSRRFLRSNVA